MGDAKRRKHLGIKSDPTDLKEKRKKHVMARAKSEPLRPGFLLDFGRALASDGCESVWCCMEAPRMMFQALPGQAGVSIQVAPSLLSCSPPPSQYGNYILTIECLSKKPAKTLFEEIKQQLAKGATLRVGYDRAYQGPGEYVVPLMLEYATSQPIGEE